MEEERTGDSEEMSVVPMQTCNRQCRNFISTCRFILRSTQHKKHFLHLALQVSHREDIFVN